MVNRVRTIELFDPIKRLHEPCGRVMPRGGGAMPLK